MTFIASSFFAGMLVGYASAHSPRETANDTKATLEAKTSKRTLRLEFQFYEDRCQDRIGF